MSDRDVRTLYSDRLFDVDEVPEVPLLREPRRRKGAQVEDERLSHDYPPEWNRCTTCGGLGMTNAVLGVMADDGLDPLAKVQMQCPACLGMGSVKARVRLEAGHRCVRCGHPYMPKHDAKMLGVEPTPYRWSPCDDHCTHGGPVRLLVDGEWKTFVGPDRVARLVAAGSRVEAEWRILTVHHLDGDKANLAWWNLLAACQRCHLVLQAKVVMERVYPHPHTEWFKPYVAGYYAHVYLGEDLTRDEVEARMDKLLGLELDAAYQ